MILDIISPETFIPFLVFAIPIIAIAGGITAGIIKSMGQQRLIELAQRERMLAIERGIDPARLPPLPMIGADGPHVFRTYHEYALRRSQGLLIGGIVTLFAGIGVGLMIYYANDHHEGWAIGLVPLAVGIGLLLSAWLTRPRNGDLSAPPPPTA